MSYTKHNYATGDTLYASDLNEMDEQIALNETNISQLSVPINDEKNQKYYCNIITYMV